MSHYSTAIPSPYKFKVMAQAAIKEKESMDNVNQYNENKQMEDLKYQGELRDSTQYSTLGGGAIGGGLSGNLAAHPSLRERVAMSLNRAQQESKRADILHELQHLLEKNPDIARILDLLEMAQMLRV